MHAIVGLLLVIIVLGGLYYMFQAGLFAPVTGIFGDIQTGYDQSYGGAAAGATSSAFHSVRIGLVALSGSTSTPSKVELTAHPKNGGVILSGWIISTEKGKFTIPAVVNRYSPSVPGVPLESIFAREGDRISLYTGKSPSGQNERVTQSEYRIWLGDFLPMPHGTIVLRDNKGLEVDRYAY
jgi:hypothetical protein